MKKAVKILFCLFTVVFVFSLFIIPAKGAEVMVPPCAEEFDYNDDGNPISIYRIYMPPPGVKYNDHFIIWAYGFQDVTDDPGISDEQLCFNDFCIPDVVVSLGFGFAVIYYGKTGLAVKEGKEKIIDLVEGLTTKDSICSETNKLDIDKVYIVGASEGGLIATLLAEQNPGLFKGGYALCGPIGDFPSEINYLGDARVTFEYFFPGEIPGYKIFNDNDVMPLDWNDYFETTILRLFYAHPWKAKQWFKVAKLPYDPENYLDTVLNSAKDVLRYSVINLPDAVKVLGGEPFDNRWKWYSGSYNDFRLNLKVKRLTPDDFAIDEMKTNYNTSGELEIPLITMHTKRDQQVPYWHEIFYILKTIKKGSFLTEHFNIPIDRYGHCNFTLEEALGGFALMLLYAGDWEMLSALETFMQAQQLEF